MNIRGVTYRDTYSSRMYQEAVGSSVKARITVRTLLHIGMRCWVSYKCSGDMAYRGISEVIYMNDYFVVFRDLRTGMKKAFDYFDVYKGFTAIRPAMDSSYENAPVVVRMENKESFV